MINMSYCFVWFESKIIKINSIFKQGKQNLTKARHFFFQNKEIIYAFFMLYYVQTHHFITMLLKLLI